MELAQTSNASDNPDLNKNTPLAKAFSLGTIAPNETSKTLVVALNVPKPKAIKNIQMALTSAGKLSFSESYFKYTTSPELRTDINPENNFQGINTDKSKTSPYNIEIKNRDNFNSEYVYINISLPPNNPIGDNTVKVCWFFDYAE